MSRQITGTTVLTGLLGSPVQHSISPLMHNEAFARLNLDYAYLCFEVGTKTLQTAVEGLRVLGVRGFNLTMPNKNLMCQLCDHLSVASQLSGAVNTVVNDHGVLTGHTTDGIGYLRAAQDAGYDLVGKKMTLLGAGGAATAILVQAALDGLQEISVFNRHSKSYERTAQIIDSLNERTSCRVQIFDLDDEKKLATEIASSDLLTNGTSVGMAPRTEGCVIPQELFGDPAVFSRDLVVSDVIYNPRETRLLRQAREVGCETFNGMYMLLYQGAESFRLWTGQEMPTKEIKELYFRESE